MKKILSFFTLAIGLFMASCASFDTPTSILLDTSLIKIDAASATFSITVTANADWQIHLATENGGLPSWLSVDCLQGNAGTHTITLSASENTGNSNRLAAVHITADAMSAKADILQMAKTSAYTDSLALVNIYYALNGPEWEYVSNVRGNQWLSEAPYYTWKGIETDEQGRVIELSLYNISEETIYGNFPEAIYTLPKLQILVLQYLPNVEGTLSSQIAALSDLTFLIIEGTAMSGTIPEEISSLSALEELVLADNYFSGTIPASLGSNMPELILLDLSANLFTGSLPINLAKCEELYLLNISFNDFSGAIPDAYATLHELKMFIAHNNSLTAMGNCWEHMHELTQLFLNDNLLTGSIPQALGQLPLTYCRLHNNSLSGEIPLGLAANHEIVKSTDLPLLRGGSIDINKFSNRNAFITALINNFNTNRWRLVD